ncbi:MAG: FeoA family protein [Verrucomicrobiota bacterium]|nr:FeoA family protein [Verrucomicrobiota bacterium]
MNTFLHQIHKGKVAKILHIDDAFPHSKRLRALGLHEGLEVEVLTDGDPVIICLHGTRVGFRRDLLEKVSVTPLDTRACQCPERRKPTRKKDNTLSNIQKNVSHSIRKGCKSVWDSIAKA